MRAIWKGQISFGLINIPIELYSAENRKDLKFHLLDSRNKAKIRYERVNEETGKEVPWDDIVKAYEVPHEGFVVLEDEDFKRAAIENTQTFEIEDFVDQEDVGSLYYEKPYYLAPSKRAEKGYVLLREVLKNSKKIAIGKVIIRTRQYLAALIPDGDVLVMDLLRFAQDIRSTEGLNIPKGSIKDYKISEKELEMAQTLVDSMTSKWDSEKYHDEYHDSLMKYIEKKAELGHIPLPVKHKEEEGKGTNVVDFMDLLKKSIEKSEPKTEKKKPAKKKTATRSRKTSKKRA